MRIGKFFCLYIGFLTFVICDWVYFYWVGIWENGLWVVIGGGFLQDGLGRMGFSFSILSGGNTRTLGLTPLILNVDERIIGANTFCLLQN